ncbi:unnamed protein product [Cuscuta epithymum]|uniref:Uncharacterized protein n=1 Tax=Cuscuta epithymum TaxID=186058 RepID=A0AAV0FD15_9ASTE|nr:unnamed protein product [Cuscuta epithymum]
MGWYYSITRLFVSPSFRLPTHHYQPSSLPLHLTTRALQRIHQWATATMSDTHDVDMYGHALTGIASLCSNVLGRVDYGHLIQMPPWPHLRFSGDVIDVYCSNGFIIADAA